VSINSTELDTEIIMDLFKRFGKKNHISLLKELSLIKAIIMILWFWILDYYTVFPNKYRI
jgi:hypothetical protein